MKGKHVFALLPQKVCLLRQWYFYLGIMPVELGQKRTNREGKNKYRVSDFKVNITFCDLPKESSSDMPLTLLSLERSKARHKTTGLIAISRVLGVHNTLTAIGNNMVGLSIKQYNPFHVASLEQ